MCGSNIPQGELKNIKSIEAWYVETFSRSEKGAQYFAGKDTKRKNVLVSPEVTLESSSNTYMDLGVCKETFDWNMKKTKSLFLRHQIIWQHVAFRISFLDIYFIYLFTSIMKL